jgi:multicomponent K+:H+ antiporter subunit E
VALALSWLALTELSVAHMTLAVLAAIAIPLTAHSFLEDLPAVHRPRRVLVLLVRVLWDIVIANAVVARLVLGPMSRLQPAFVQVPLALTHPHARTLLATIITMTPGTVSVAFTPDARVLHVHALNVQDPARLVASIKERYERPLMEILEC